jgi:hypothetical protein
MRSHESPSTLTLTLTPARVTSARFASPPIGYQRHMSDEQDHAEAVDEEEAFGAEQATSDMSGPIDPIPDSPLGLPFADADVTDESVADRAAREEPEVWEQRRTADGEDRDVLEMADPLEIREGFEITRDIDLDELPADPA